MKTILIGKVLNESGEGISGLIVAAISLKGLIDEELLSFAQTINGDFNLIYDDEPEGFSTLAPSDIAIKIFNSSKRLLWNNTLAASPSPFTVVIPTIEHQGFLVTLKKDGPQRLSLNNSIEFILDNEAAWKIFVDAIDTASTEISFQQFYLDIERVFASFNPPDPLIGVPTTGKRIEESLLAANRNRKVSVHFLIRDVDLLPYPVDTEGRVLRYFKRANGILPHSIEVRRFTSAVSATLHAKFAVIDNKTAYFITSPLTQDYYSSSRHEIDDKRRGPLTHATNFIDILIDTINLIVNLFAGLPIKLFTGSFFAIPSGIAMVPVHDVNFKLDGPAVNDLNDTFFSCWKKAGGVTAHTNSAFPSTGETAAVQVLRTFTPKAFGDDFGETGEFGILEAYQRAISQATNFIYLENQYFSEKDIADSLVVALRKNRNLQLIFVLNNNPDLGAGDMKKLVREISTSIPADQFAFFTLWTHEGEKIIPNYIHSKIAIVDDAWATIGSCNLDEPGLYRSVEVNIAMFNDIDGQPKSILPSKLRRMLWAEHLGFDDADASELLTPPNGGWLKLWNIHAQNKVKQLINNPTTPYKARILPWSFETKPEKYLKELHKDILTEKLKCLDKVRSFSFEKGQWLD